MSSSSEFGDWRPTVKNIETRVSDLQNSVFGYWEGATRYKGLIEQNNDILEAIAKRDKEFESLFNHITSVAWKIAKPIIYVLAFLALVGVMDLVVRGGGFEKATSAVHSLSK